MSFFNKFNLIPYSFLLSVGTFAISEVNLPKKPFLPRNSDFTLEISSKEIGIEILFGKKDMDVIKEILFIEKMKPVKEEKGTVTYYCCIPPIKAGVYDYAFRVYPRNPMLPHRMDFPLVKWV